MNIGDHVYVINWDKQYSTFRKWVDNKWVQVFNWNTDIPQYGGTQLFIKNKEHIYKNFKYEIIETIDHPNRNGKLLLLKSKEGCYVQIVPDGVSYLTPEQYADKEFNVLIEHHKKRYSPNDDNLRKVFPKELLKKIYDKNDNVLFGSNMTKGKVTYNYIPGEFMIDGVPFIISTSCLYDGKGNSDLPEDVEIMSYNDLKFKFTNNEYD